MWIDIHAHLSAYTRDHRLIAKTLFSTHTPKEVDTLFGLDHPWLYRSAGVHPQDVRMDYFEHLSDRLATKGEKTLHAIGEIGFDLWPEFRHTLALQRSIFVEELRLAQQYHLPIVVHQRRAMHEIFAQISSLKRLPAVIFHGYSGTFLEALSLRKRGVHAYFSVGTPLLWGSKIAQQLAKNLPLAWLFLETDAPYQPRRGVVATPWQDLLLIYAAVAQIRGISIDELQAQLAANFDAIFLKKAPNLND